MIDKIARIGVALIFVLFCAILLSPLFALTEREVWVAHSCCETQGLQGYNNINLPFGFTNMVFTVHCEVHPMEFVESSYK